MVAGGSATLLYSGDPIRTLIADSFIISNSDAGNANVSLYLVKPGDSPSINNAVVHLVKLAGNSYIQGNGGFVVPPSYKVYVQSTSTNLVIATLGGTLGVNV